MGYLHLGTNPDPKKHIFCTFYVESELSMPEIAEHIAAESSIGTWTDLATLRPKIAEKIGAKVYKIDPNQKIVKIAYPLDLFELGNIPQLKSSIMGNIFSMKVLKNLRLLEIKFPKVYIESFPGPKYGAKGVKKYFGFDEKRPVIGCIVKPKVGLTSKEHAQVAYNVWTNGVDLVKDDENLTDLKFNRFKDRVDEVMKLKKKAEKKTGQKKIHVFNITGPMDVMLDRAEYVQKKGGKCVLVDLVSTGLDNVQVLRKANFDLIIHGHRAGHSLFTRNPRHGMTMYVLAELSRLAGIDQLHTGTVTGKMEGGKKEILSINKMLGDKFSNLKKVLPIASGGLHPGIAAKTLKILGNNVVINFGGGIHGHPGGSAAGARAAKLAVDAYMKGLSIKEAIKKPEYHELAQAVETWGTK